MWKNYCDQYRAALFEKTMGDMIEQEVYALINAKWDIISDYLNIPKDDIAWMLAVPIMDWLNEPEARYCDAAKNLTLNFPLPESGIKAFVAAVFGGIGSIPGAMIGGILLGVIEILSKAYISSQVE